MSLSTELSEYIAACFTGLWIRSHEHEDALAEIAALCQQQHWPLAVFDIERGLRIPGGSATPTSASDPLAAIRAVTSLATPDGSAVLVLVNFHRFLQSAEIIQALAHQIIAGKQQRTFLVILSPVVQIPTELEKHFVVIEHALPCRQQLETIARGIAVEENELPEELTPVLDAAAGLTRYEAEAAFSLSLVRHGRLEADAVWQLKTQTLTKSGLLALHRGHNRFADLGGLGALKAFCQRSLRRHGSVEPLRRPRGVLLLSPPGCGKSQFAKCLGNEVGRPTITLDFGALYGSLVGQTEANVRQALATIDAMAPAICFMDELEKTLSGGGTAQGDSGVSSRLFGSVLSWMNDRTSDIYLVGTCNDISRLPPELTRAERWDAIYFLDLPQAEERAAIWQIYLRLFDLDPEQARPQDDTWTGAEIRSCCRLAALLDLPLTAAAQNIVPVAVTAAESVERLRRWASGRCLDSAQGGLYQFEPQAIGRRRRAVRKPVDPEQN